MSYQTPMRKLRRWLTRRSTPALFLGVLMVIMINGMPFISVSPAQGAISDDHKGSGTLCHDTDLTSFLPLPYGVASDMMSCKQLWNSFVMRYSQSKNNVITIVLSAMYTSGWVSIGFSRDGMMLNASCMVGWMSPQGQGRIRQYYVEGFTPAQVIPAKGELPLTTVPPYVALRGATIYLAFQLKYNKTLQNQPLLLAFSSKYPHRLHLPVHEDKTTITFDFSNGFNDHSSTRVIKNERAHGILAILGWGALLPVGAIFARYLKHKDPLWYSLHLLIQIIGFLLGVAAVVVGIWLDNKLHAASPAHKGIGIFVLVLTVLQVLAFFLRPSLDSKLRKYWNMYHNWLGRICLFFGAVNIVVGIHVAGSGAAWKVVYGILVGLTMVVCVVLEVLRRLKRLEEADITPVFSGRS